ncbi:LysR substrate-binding domain-containing protein [Sulfurovum sp.]|uniref:LysR substrate-binding domain-containing protein n=1 Tax=Sulfurovum sp. TaxID=1969726 RepID=UPI0025E23C0C|nr:LysR substrate-binding domain-containing protein [Sulfurovum sp.]
MTLRELELFYYLADNTHVSQLAQKLSISQSAISLSIKSLEKKLSEPLFDRIGKKLILNERGRFFKEKTYPHYLILKEAEHCFKHNRFSGILRISSSKSIGEFIMPQVMYDFLSEYTDVALQHQIRNSADILKEVLTGSTDIGFVEMVCKETDLIKHQIGKDQLIVVSSDAKLAEKTYYIDQLFSKKWLLREEGSGTREVFLKRLGKLASDLPVFMHFTEFEEVKTLLCNNAEAITCISRFAVKKALESKELYEIKLHNMTFEREFYMVYHKNKYQSKLFETFTSLSKEYFH